jgi:hypothetical protein
MKGTLIPTPNATRFSTNKDVDLTDAQVLSDDRPVFDKLNNQWNEEWRQLAIDNALTEVVKYKIPFSDESRFWLLVCNPRHAIVPDSDLLSRLRDPALIYIVNLGLGLVCD